MVSTSGQYLFIAISKTHDQYVKNTLYWTTANSPCTWHIIYQGFDHVQFLGHFVSNMFLSYTQRRLMININTRL